MKMLKPICTCLPDFWGSSSSLLFITFGSLWPVMFSQVPSVRHNHGIRIWISPFGHGLANEYTDFHSGEAELSCALIFGSLSLSPADSCQVTHTHTGQPSCPQNYRLESWRLTRCWGPGEKLHWESVMVLTAAFFAWILQPEIRPHLLTF